MKASTARRAEDFVSICLYICASCKLSFIWHRATGFSQHKCNSSVKLDLVLGTILVAHASNTLQCTSEKMSCKSVPISALKQLATSLESLQLSGPYCVCYQCFTCIVSRMDTSVSAFCKGSVKLQCTILYA